MSPWQVLTASPAAVCHLGATLGVLGLGHLLTNGYNAGGAKHSQLLLSPSDVLCVVLVLPVCVLLVIKTSLPTNMNPISQMHKLRGRV